MNYSLGTESGLLGTLLAMVALGILAWNWTLLRAKPATLRRLRAAALLALAACLMELTVEHLKTRSVKPRLAVLVDTGLTMGAADGGRTSRLERSVEWLLGHRGELSARADVALYAADDRARRVGWDELRSLAVSPAGFDLGAAVKDVAADGPAPRLWLLGDGNSEGGAGADAAAQAWKAPVDSLGVGPRKAARAIYLTELQTPDFVFLHSRFPVAARFEASNLRGASVEARLWKGSALVDTAVLPVRGDYEAFSATFTASAEALGQERYRVELAVSRPSGASARVSREFGVEVIRQKHRIMYLAGRPSPEYAQLRELLKSNPNFELVSFVILRNPENISPVPDNELSLIPFPAQEIFVQDLMQFDVFILENFAYWRFNLPVAYLEGLKRFVAQGGALLVIGGSSAFTQGGYRGTPLEEALPVTLWNSADDYVPGLFKPKTANPSHPLLLQADAPEASSSLWEALPDLDGFNRFAAVRPGATVLLTHPTERTPGGAPMPLLAIRDFGKGKVMVLGTDSTWRWKMGGGLDWKAAPFYGRFWSKAVQYLSGTLDLKKVKFSPLPERMAAREPAEITLHLFDESFRPLAGSDAELKVVWTPPDGRARAVTPHEKETGVYEVELTGLAEGAHTLRAAARYHGLAWGQDEVRFRWEMKAPEAPLQRRALSGLADATSGRYADLDRVSVSEWLGALPRVRTEPEVLRRWHLWAWSGWLWLIAGLLLTEWILRRRWGYV